jgi:hypothetical protein
VGVDNQHLTLESAPQKESAERRSPAMSWLGWLIIIALITAAAATLLAAWHVFQSDNDEENIGY